MIRALRQEEIKRHADCGRFCYEELSFGRDFDAEHFCTIWSSFYQAHAGVIFVDERDQEAVGYIGGVVYVDPFDKKLTVQELLWYVKPEYRNFETAKGLLTHLERWAEGKKAYSIRLAAPHEKAELGLLLLRNGYRHLETMYERVLA